MHHLCYIRKEIFATFCEKCFGYRSRFFFLLFCFLSRSQSSHAQAFVLGTALPAIATAPHDSSWKTQFTLKLVCGSLGTSMADTPGEVTTLKAPKDIESQDNDEKKSQETHPTTEIGATSLASKYSLHSIRIKKALVIMVGISIY